jgi:hypothetical protein
MAFLDLKEKAFISKGRIMARIGGSNVEKLKECQQSEGKEEKRASSLAFVYHPKSDNFSTFLSLASLSRVFLAEKRSICDHFHQHIMHSFYKKIPKAQKYSKVISVFFAYWNLHL